MVTASGGSIEATSEPGNTTFVVKLPLSTSEPAVDPLRVSARSA
jgi:nitrogen-specific signal transduction histidine kinase